MIKRLEIKTKAKGVMLLNEFIIENREIFNELDFGITCLLENSKTQTLFF